MVWANKRTVSSTQHNWQSAGNRFLPGPLFLNIFSIAHILDIKFRVVIHVVLFRVRTTSTMTAFTVKLIKTFSCNGCKTGIVRAASKRKKL